MDRFQGFSGDLNHDYNSLVDNIYCSLLSAGASKQPLNAVKKKSPTSWWDDECKDVISRRSQIFRVFKQSPSSANLSAYLEFRKYSAKFFAKKKRTTFRDFCSSLNMNTPLTSVWRYIRSFSNNNNSPPSLISENSFTEAFDKSPPSLPSTPDIQCVLSLIHNAGFDVNINKEFMLTPFTKLEYKEAIATLKIRSSSGPDLISNKII